MHGREVHPESGMPLEPGTHLCAAMNAYVVTNDVDGRDPPCRFLVDLFEEFDELHLALAATAYAVDLAGARIKGGEEIQGALSLVLVFDADGREPWQCGTRRMRTGPRLQGRFLVETQNPLVQRQMSCVQVADVQDRRAKRIVARNLGAQPVMDPPRLQFECTEDPLHGLRRNRLDDTVLNQRPCELCARPQRKRSPDRVRQLTRELDEI